MEQPELIVLLNQHIKTHTSNQRNRSYVASDLAASYIKATKAAVKRVIIDELDQTYTKDDLQELASIARPMLKANGTLLEGLGLNMPYSILLSTDPSTLSKAQLVWGVAIIFSHANVYRLFSDQLPPDLQQAAHKLTWFTKIQAGTLGQLVGTPITFTSSNAYYASQNTDLISRFKWLPHKSTGWDGGIVLEWPKNIRTFLQTVYPKPDDFNLKTFPGPAPDWLLWDDGETVVFEELQKLLAYRMQDNIPINNSGKVAGNGLKKMRKMLGLHEFFSPDSAFPFLRTACLAQMLASFEPKKKQATVDSLALLKVFYDLLPSHFNLLFLLNDLRNHGHVSLQHYKQEAEQALIEWLKRLPIGEWVAIDNMLAYAQLHELSVLPCPTVQVSSLAYEQDSTRNPGYTLKQNVSAAHAYRLLEKPSLLAGFFLCASLGWLDIAFVEPAGKFGTDYFSAYDGLKAVRLNALGAHITGRTTGVYVPKVNTATQALRFDEQSLLIFCDPDNVVAGTILANYAERVSPTRFRVTAGSFLKDCKSKQQLLSKISLFTQSIAPDLPPNWQFFFDDLMGKADPLKTVTNMTTYRISPGDHTLIRLLAQDAVLKNLVVKAEGFRILIADDQLPKFKSRLRDLGYLIS